MAGVFTFAFLVVVGGFVGSIGVFRNRDERGGRLTWGCLPFTVVFWVFLEYLLTKFVYEELYPCVAVDSKYCDFASTQYHDLFGWEF
jgi:hypothetical protein